MDNCVSENNLANDDEEILDWKKEAAAIIRDVGDHVNDIRISSNLPSSLLEIFLNVCTLENTKYCIRASGSGFQVAGNSYDNIELLSRATEDDDIFETPYALLTHISPSYVQSFANKLARQIENTLMQE